MNRVVTLTTTAVIALAMTGCVDRQAQKQAQKTQELVNNPTRAVSVQPAKTQALVEYLNITGSVTTSEDTSVGPKQTGKLVAVYVRDGDNVSAGQLIATQDTSQLNAQLRSALAGMASAQSQLSAARSNAAISPSRTASAVRQAEAQLRSARAQLKKAQQGARAEERTQAEWQVRAAKSNLDTAQKELDRVTRLVNEGAFARQRLDEAQNAYNAALTQYNSALQSQLVLTRGNRPEDISVAQEAVRQAEEALQTAKTNKRLDITLDDQVRTAQAQVQSAQAQVDIARQAIEDAQIRAPFAGKVNGRPMQPGAIVSPGAAVARIIGSGGVYFEGEVPEANISRVKIGDPVAVSVTALPGRTFAGVVAAVSPQAQEIGRFFNVRIQLSGETAEVRPGMFASGQVRLRTIPNATVVPASSVVERGGRSVVFLAQDGKAKQVVVTVGMRQENVVQVTGINSGDPVIIRGQEALEEGSLIQVQSATLKASAPGGSVGG
jgi:HlyD family secretion protein